MTDDDHCGAKRNTVSGKQRVRMAFLASNDCLYHRGATVPERRRVALHQGLQVRRDAQEADIGACVDDDGRCGAGGDRPKSQRRRVLTSRRRGELVQEVQDDLVRQAAAKRAPTHARVCGIVN